MIFLPSHAFHGFCCPVAWSIMVATDIQKDITDP